MRRSSLFWTVPPGRARSASTTSGTVASWNTRLAILRFANQSGGTTRTRNESSPYAVATPRAVTRPTTPWTTRARIEARAGLGSVRAEKRPERRPPAQEARLRREEIDARRRDEDVDVELEELRRRRPRAAGHRSGGGAGLAWAGGRRSGSARTLPSTSTVHARARRPRVPSGASPPSASRTACGVCRSASASCPRSGSRSAGSRAACSRTRTLRSSRGAPRRQAERELRLTSTYPKRDYCVQYREAYTFPGGPCWSLLPPLRRPRAGPRGRAGARGRRGGVPRRGERMPSLRLSARAPIAAPRRTGT